MQPHRLTINLDWFYLSAEYDVAGLKAALAAAVQHGGGFVDVTGPDGTHTAVLITAHTTVKFETLKKVDPVGPIEFPRMSESAYVDEEYWFS